MRQEKEHKIVPPQDGWEQDTIYLVEVAFDEHNLVHQALLWVGFLTTDKSEPGGYSCIFNNTYNMIIRYSSNLHYLKVISKLHKVTWAIDIQ